MLLNHAENGTMIFFLPPGRGFPLLQVLNEYF